MGFATADEIEEFFRSCPEFERMLVRSGISLIKYWFSVSDAEQERRFAGAHPGSDEALEAVPDGPPVPCALGRVLDRQGRDVPAHRHQAGAMVGRERRRQAAGAAQRHPPPAVADSLPGPDAAPDRAAAARAGSRLRPAADRRADRSCPTATDADRDPRHADWGAGDPPAVGVHLEPAGERRIEEQVADPANRLGIRRPDRQRRRLGRRDPALRIVLVRDADGRVGPDRGRRRWPRPRSRRRPRRRTAPPGRGRTSPRRPRRAGRSPPPPRESRPSAPARRARPRPSRTATGPGRSSSPTGG